MDFGMKLGFLVEDLIGEKQLLYTTSSSKEGNNGR